MKHHKDLPKNYRNLGAGVRRPAAGPLTPMGELLARLAEDIARREEAAPVTVVHYPDQKYPVREYLAGKLARHQVSDDLKGKLDVPPPGGPAHWHRGRFPPRLRVRLRPGIDRLDPKALRPE